MQKEALRVKKVAKLSIMDDANTIVDQLLKSEDDNEFNYLLEAFKTLPTDKKSVAEERLIRLLNDPQIDKAPRSWITTMLGQVGTPAAKKALMDRALEENVDLVRHWAIVNLCRFFDGDEIAVLVEEQFDRENTFNERIFLAHALSLSKSPVAFSKLEKLLEDPNPGVRYRAVDGIRNSPQKREALPELLELLDNETDNNTLILVLETLRDMDDQQIVPSLIDLLREHPLESYDVGFAAITTLTTVADPDNEEVVKALLEIICNEDLEFSIAATRGLMTFFSPEEATRRLVDFSQQDVKPEQLPNIANALRFLGAPAAIKYLSTIPDERAEKLLEEIGGRSAVNVLVDRRLNNLNEIQSRLKVFDNQALEIFNDTMFQAKRGFKMSLWMSAIIFGIGVILLILSIYLAALPNASQFQRVYGVGGGLAGLGTVLTMFYRGPIERIERAVTNLVQIEIAFLAYVRQITQITTMFEREYVDNDNFTIKELGELLQCTEKIMKETMPLVRRYTMSIKDKEA